jgi:hypothetical protein
MPSKVHVSACTDKASEQSEQTKKGLPLDTLAQSGTKTENEEDFAPLKAGVKLEDKKALLKRARRKYFTSGIIPALVDASKDSGNKLLKSYWNTYHCANTLTLRSDGKVSGKYCKNRWCMVCNAIRTAQLIKRYQPEIDSWENKQFVTLTIPNVDGADLAEVVTDMIDKFRTIHRRMKKQYQRGKREKFIGIRKLECTYNPHRNDFHPHFHFVIQGLDNSKELINHWLKEYPSANRKAQDLRPADDRSTLEMFKYFTKVISGKGKNKMIYGDALNQIFISIRGKRTFQPVGFKSQSCELTETEKENVVYAIKEYTWDAQKTDWTSGGLSIDYETGEIIDESEALTGYRPGEKFKEFVETKIVYRKGQNWTPKEMIPFSPDGELILGKDCEGEDFENPKGPFGDPLIKNINVIKKGIEKKKKEAMKEKSEKLLESPLAGFNWTNYLDKMNDNF